MNNEEDADYHNTCDGEKRWEKYIFLAFRELRIIRFYLRLG